MENRAGIAAVVLAAGAGRRIGRPKQLLPLGGRCLLQWVIDAASDARVDEIVVVLGHHADEIERALRLPARPPSRVVRNPDPDRGLASSLAVALRALGSRAGAAAVLLGDQPGIETAVIDAALACFRRSCAPLLRVRYRARSGANAPAHPVVIDRRLWPRVGALRGRAGARELFQQPGMEAVELEVDREPPQDVDSWGDYERLRRLWMRRAPPFRGEVGLSRRRRGSEGKAEVGWRSKSVNASR